MSDEMTAMDLCDFYVGSQGRESPMANETVRVNYKDFMAIRTDLAAAKERAVKIDVQMSQRDDLLDELTTKLCNANETCDTLRTENAALREMIDRARECARCDYPKSTAGFAPWKDCGECVGCQCQAALAARKDTTDDK